MPGGSKSRADAVLAIYLSAGKSIREAAALAGVAERTVYRRLVQPEFRGKLAVLRGQMIDRLASRISGAGDEVFQKLHSLMEAESEPVRLGAVKTMLDQMIRLREAVEFESRLCQVEQLCDRKLGLED